jgi:hypothetical protein
VEAAGIPTLSLSSAYSITRSVCPPRSVFLDFPLGHTAGKPGEPELNRDILANSLAAFESMKSPGAIVSLPYVWSDDDGWKDRALRPASADAPRDERAARSDKPQYQSEDDEMAAAAVPVCDCCVRLEPR